MTSTMNEIMMRPGDETNLSPSNHVSDISPNETHAGVLDEDTGETASAEGYRKLRHMAVGPKILVVDADPVSRRSIRQRLESIDYRITEAENGRQALALLTQDTAVAIIDMLMLDINALDCIRYIQRQFPDTQILVLTTAEHHDYALRAIKLGALEAIVKPFDSEELMIRTKQAVGTARLIRENRALRQAVGSPTPPTRLVGQSHQMQTVRKQIEAFGKLDSTVLVTGSTGTGKSSVAQLIHRNSARHNAPFVVVNCKAMPRELIGLELFGYVRGMFSETASDRPGRIEVAHGGTLFLDEVAELPFELQDKLLQFLQEHTVRRLGANVIHEVNARVIAATSRDLASLCRDGRFREDLYLRLNVLSIHMPSLGERPDDIPTIAEELLERLARRNNTAVPTLADDALATLRQHPWPGNVREMEQVLERACSRAGGNTITSRDLVFDRLVAGDGASDSFLGLAGMTMAEIERRAIIETIRAYGGNRAKSARKLGVSEKTIYNKIRQFKLRGIV